MIFDRELEVYCPICGREFQVTYNKDRDGYMIVECPQCGEELAFAVVIKTIKVAKRDSDVQTVEEFFGDK